MTFDDSIVGFYVEPLSITHKTQSGTTWDGKGDAPTLSTCASKSKHLTYDNVKGNPQKVNPGQIIFSYDVQWRESDIKWASRWDVYLSMDHAVPDKVHWFSIINSILIVFFLAVIVAMILIRSLHRDISQYNRVSTSYRTFNHKTFTFALLRYQPMRKKLMNVKKVVGN